MWHLHTYAFYWFVNYMFSFNFARPLGTPLFFWINQNQCTEHSPPNKMWHLHMYAFFILYLFYDPLRITKKRKRKAFQSAGAPYAPGRPTTESFAAEKF